MRRFVEEVDLFDGKMGAERLPLGWIFSLSLWGEMLHVVGLTNAVRTKFLDTNSIMSKSIEMESNT